MEDKWSHKGVWSLTVGVEVKSENRNCGTGKIH